MAFIVDGPLVVRIYVYVFFCLTLRPWLRQSRFLPSA